MARLPPGLRFTARQADWAWFVNIYRRPREHAQGRRCLAPIQGERWVPALRRGAARREERCTASGTREPYSVFLLNVARKKLSVPRMLRSAKRRGTASGTRDRLHRRRGDAAVDDDGLAGHE